LSCAVSRCRGDTRGAVTIELLRDGRVLAVMPPTALPFGVALQATVTYPSLGAFLSAAKRAR
jgi:hypothetical protein